MANRYQMEPKILLDTLKNTVFKGATNEQLGALVVVANEHGLNPFTREIYAFSDKSGGIQAVVGVDGWLRIINQNPNFDGVEFVQDDKACTCILYVKGRTHPVKVTEYLGECARNTDPWRQYPRRMLRHKALIQAGRIAFGYGALRDEDDFSVHPSSATVQVFSPPHALPQDAEEPTAAAEPQAGQEVQSQAGQSAAADIVQTPQDQLTNLVCAAGFTFDDFRRWGIDSGAVPEAAEYGSFDEVTTSTAKRLVKAHKGMLQGLNAGRHHDN